MGSPTWLARTMLEWAELLSARTAPEDAERARRLAESALGAAELAGQSAVAERARALIGGG